MVVLRNKTICKIHVPPQNTWGGETTNNKLQSILLYLRLELFFSQWIRVHHCRGLVGGASPKRWIGAVCGLITGETSSLGPWSLSFFPRLRRAALIRHLLAKAYHSWPTKGSSCSADKPQDNQRNSCSPSCWSVDQALCCKRGALPSPTSSLSRKRECECVFACAQWRKAKKDGKVEILNTAYLELRLAPCERKVAESDHVLQYNPMNHETQLILF